VLIGNAVVYIAIRLVKSIEMALFSILAFIVLAAQFIWRLKTLEGSEVFVWKGASTSLSKKF
jgi:ABC-type transport system involved in cytochrome bd biosynthesis fused ATPase/permease subunit